MTDKRTQQATRLEKISDIHFVEHSDGGRMNMVAHWQDLRVQIINPIIWVSEIGLVEHPDSFMAASAPNDASVVWKLDAPNDAEIIADRSSSDADSATVTAQKKWTLATAFCKPAKETSTSIQAEFIADKKRRIGFIEDGRQLCGRERGGRLDIMSSEEKRKGVLYVVKEEIKKWRTETDPIGTLKIETYLPLVQLERFASRLRHAPSHAECIALLSVLCFENEVERSFAKWEDEQTYYFDPTGFSPVILKALTIADKVHPMKPDADIGDDM